MVVIGLASPFFHLMAEGVFLMKFLKISYVFLVVISMIYFLMYVLLKHYLAIELDTLWDKFHTISGFIIIFWSIPNLISVFFSQDGGDNKK